MMPRVAVAGAAGLCVLALVGLAAQRWLSSQPVVAELPPGARLDRAHRVAVWPGKREAPCPLVSARVATVLVLGQSNAGNHAQGAGEPAPDADVLNWFDGKCYIASSPLLGATGELQQPWIAMARLMLKSGQLEHVVLAPIAVAGSPIARWASSGDLHPVLLDDAARLQRQLAVSAVLWVQGEADFGRSTAPEAYASMLADVVTAIRRAGIAAPVYVYTATWCLDTARWTPSNPLARMQRAVALAGTKPGVDLDALLLAQDRFDGCHLGASGIRKVADASARLLLGTSPP